MEVKRDLRREALEDRVIVLVIGFMIINTFFAGLLLLVNNMIPALRTAPPVTCPAFPAAPSLLVPPCQPFHIRSAPPSFALERR